LEDVVQDGDEDAVDGLSIAVDEDVGTQEEVVSMIAVEVVVVDPTIHQEGVLTPVAVKLVME
jgi:hypothetical protein